MNQPPRAIPFICIDNDGQFSISQEAMSTLEAHQARKLKVIAFAGPLSSGKSFLAN